MNTEARYQRPETQDKGEKSTLALRPSPFTIYPAIDLRNGRVVRLKYGDPNQQTIFSDDPLAIARQWVAAGATWLHVVNLNGAFDEVGTANWQILPQLTQQGARVQFGGGVRSLADVGRVLTAGAVRVVLGTVAIEQPEMVAEAITQFGADKIAVGIDARDGVVKTRGWVKDTAVSPIELGIQMKAFGVQTVIYTDISRDGVLAGVNVAKTAELAQATGLDVIASGGAASLQDVERTVAVADKGVVGVIVGRALYDGRLDLQKAINLLVSSRQLLQMNQTIPVKTIYINKMKLPSLLVDLVESNRWQLPDNIKNLSKITGVNHPGDFSFLSFEGMERETQGCRELAQDSEYSLIYSLYSSGEGNTQAASKGSLDIDLAVMIAVNWDEEAIFLDFRQNQEEPTVVLAYWSEETGAISHRQLTEDFRTFAGQIGLYTV